MTTPLDRNAELARLNTVLTAENRRLRQELEAAEHYRKALEVIAAVPPCDCSAYAERILRTKKVRKPCPSTM